ncbi:MAG: TMEM175 family protein [Dehalococcoidales bacterium]|nr:TMEM175 family protein [Dehalococcoidales bacterium]
MAQEQHGENDDGLKDRIITLSEGIFAFAMTLLVLALEVPVLASQASPDDLLGALLGLWPRLESYIISFLVIGAYWSGQHRIFRYIRRADGGMAWLNILYLMCISFMPFPTAVLGAFSRNQVAVAFYAATMATAGLLTWSLWNCATNGHRLVDPDLAPRLIAYNSLTILLSAAVFLVSIGISFWSPALAMYSWLLTAAVHPMLDRIYGLGAGH